MMPEAVKQTIELDQKTADAFKAYCRYEGEINKILDSGLLTVYANPSWKQLYDFAHKMQFGTVQVTFKDSAPIRIDNPMQTIIFRI